MQLPPRPPYATDEYLARTIAPKLLAVDGTLYSLAMLCVLMRIYVRVFMLKTFGPDGKTLLLALLVQTR